MTLRAHVVLNAMLAAAFTTSLYANDLRKQFESPLPEFSPVPIWWWSGDRIEKDRVRVQLEQIAKGGIHNAIILNLAPSGPLYGSAADDPPFLTEAWWDLFGYALQEGKRVGVKLWFYDQLGFSGSGLQARVVRDHPDYRGISLMRTIKDVEGPADVELRTPADGTPLAAFVARRVSQDASSAENPLATKIEAVQKVNDKIVDGLLRVSVPEGSYRVQLFYTVPGGFDYHNPAAGAALIDIVHGEMERRFKDELGQGIAGSFQDEFPPMPRFSRRLPEEFKKRCGYDLLDKLPALYNDVIDRFGASDGPSTIQIRCEANAVAAELCEEAFFRPLHEWHQKYNMLCGYDQTCRNADPLFGESYYVDYFKTMRHFSAPGNEQSGDAKPHQSIADLYERPRVWMEGFHSSGWGQTPEDIMTLLHAWMAEGSTLYNPHAIYYSTHGSYYEWAPPDTGWRQPYYVHYGVLADYVSRLSFMLTRGRHVADVAILHPANTVHAYHGYRDALPAAKQANDMYWALKGSLGKSRLDYIVIDEDSIQRATVEKGVLSVGQARVRMIALPAARVLAGATLAKISQFVDSGGSVVIAGAAPEAMADHSLDAAKFGEMAGALKSRATVLNDVGRFADIVAEKFGRDLTQKLPMLHRKVDDRDFYFVLSDDGTPTNAAAEIDINKRDLWKLPAARGERLALDLAADGVPEVWDCIQGKVVPVLNYQRKQGRTVAQVELTETPAPLVAIRPARPDEPRAIESDLNITEVRRDGDTVLVRGMPRLDGTREMSTDHTVRVDYQDGVYAGKKQTAPAIQIPLPEVMTCRLAPTDDNRYGDFAWPPSDGPLPVEIRSMRYRAEKVGEDATPWKAADYEDSAWDTVIASFGPRASWCGPIAVPAGESFETLRKPSGLSGKISQAEYSLKQGINEDPVFAAALGGKGRIPEEFIDMKGVKGGEIYHLSTIITLPPDATGGKDVIDAVLRIGGEAKKRAFLNGEEIRFDCDSAARVLNATIKLHAGKNTFEIVATRVTDGRLRLFYQFLPTGGVVPDPQWIWSRKAGSTHRAHFTKTIRVDGDVQSAAMVVALGDLHQIRINGKLVADQGNFDPYFTSRAERYDITKFMRKGDNKLVIEARDTGSPTGLLLDGRIDIKSGKPIVFVSDASFAVSADGRDGGTAEPARVLATPSMGYLGETAVLLLEPRPHPLPQGGWLLNQSPLSPPFDRLVYSTGDSEPPPAWYRFRVPPGATWMTIHSNAQIEAYVDGKAVGLTSDKKGLVSAKLPDADSPRRIAALRIRTVHGFERGAAILSPIRFTMGPGRIPLGSWDELGLPHYSGGVRYSTDVTIPEHKKMRLTLDLGRVRGAADVTVNGKACGARLWHPYRFDITEAAKAGTNKVEIRVLNTLGPHFGVGHPSGHVFENHTKSGLFGPISVTGVEPVELRLEKAKP